MDRHTWDTIFPEYITEEDQKHSRKKFEDITETIFREAVNKEYYKSHREFLEGTSTEREAKEESSEGSTEGFEKNKWQEFD